MRWDVAGKFCCVECFQHPWLRKHISDHSSECGRCPYCGARKAALIEVADLSTYFGNLIQMYSLSESEEGDPLYYLMQDQWQIFNDDSADSGNAAALVTDIMRASWDDDDGESPVDANDLYITRVSSVEYLERWEEFLVAARDTAEPVRTRAADTVFSKDQNGYGIGFSICGIYSFSLVENSRCCSLRRRPGTQPPLHRSASGQQATLRILPQTLYDSTPSRHRSRRGSLHE
jgi:hypothetical protein